MVRQVVLWLGVAALALGSGVGGEAKTTLRGGAAEARAGALSSVAVGGLAMGGPSLGSAGAQASPATATATSSGLDRTPGLTAAGSAAAHALTTSATSGLAHAAPPLDTIAPASSTLATSGQIGDIVGTRIRRETTNVAGYQRSSSMETGRGPMAVVSLGNSRSGDSEMAAGSTGVQVGRLATAVSLGSALQMLAGARSAVNAASTAADSPGATSALTVGSSSVNTH